MYPAYDKALRTLKRQKSDVFANLEQWPEESLRRAPAAGCWSALQVVEHLYKTERGILGAVVRGLDDPHPITTRDRAGVLMIETIFRSPMPVKVPAEAAQVMPAGEAEVPGLAQLCSTWGMVEPEMEAVFERVPEPVRSLGVFRHPVGGWMTPAQVLTFFSVHITHHNFQLARIRRGASTAAHGRPAS